FALLQIGNDALEPQTPTREVFWNVSHGWGIYPLFAISLGLAGYGLFQRWQSWRQGLPVDRFDRPQERLRVLLQHAFGQQRTLREQYARIFHAFIFFGFIILTIATTVVMIQHDFGVPLMRGWFYLIFQSLIVDLFGALALLGVVIALWRRWRLKPKKLVYTGE